MTMIFVHFLIIYIINCLNLSRATVIELDQGLLSGKEEISEDGRTYFSFKGIPFAQPPVGELRFEYPRPVLKWDGVLDTTKERSLCSQAAIGYEEGEEDCLYISVYTPKLPHLQGNESKLPVLIWLHGGAFVTGGASEYSPHLMMDRDIILVLPQYRLGLLGFFSTHTPYAGGNYGIIDQLEAMKWVKKNIAKFGGDASQVTLGGDCAGGVSSILHMMSPISEGLFQRVMSFSGSPLSYWALHPNHGRLGLFISNIVKCPAHDAITLIDCFRKRPVNELMDAQRQVLEMRDLMVGNHKLAPSTQIPAYSHYSTLFMEEVPLKLLLRGNFPKLPVLLSVTGDVGSYLLDTILYDYILQRRESKPNFLNELLQILVREFDIRDVETDKFRNFYLPDWNFEDLDAAIPGLIEMMGDSAFNAPILALAKILSEQTDTKLFRFDYEHGPKLYDSRHPDNASVLPPIPKTSISHGDEMFFFLPSQRFELSTEHKRIVTYMLDITEDFVSGREKINTWPSFTGEGLETNVITASGGIEKGVPFVYKRKEKFLQYIYETQQQSAFKSIEEEGDMDITRWKHEEL